MHPLVSQMKPNEEQILAILARGQDVVVTAGAGTGKTRTLVARYISLLAEGLPLRSIVAITFTRKAAREMRNRVRAVIGRYLAGNSSSAEEHRVWDSLYQELDAARIGTIHFLCTEILRAHPAEAEVDPRFDVLDEGEAAILVNQALEEAMAWAVDDPGGVQLFTFLGERQLRTHLEKMMQARLKTSLAFSNQPMDLWAEWEAELIKPIRSFIGSPRVASAFADLSLMRADNTLAKAQAKGDALAEPLANLLTTWDNIQIARSNGDWIAISTMLADLRRHMKQKGRKGNWAGYEPKLIIKELQQIYDLQLKDFVGGGINLGQDRSLAHLMPFLHALFNQADSAYQQLKKERQALDFDDLEEKAVSLLQNRSDVRRRWQEEIRAILVDEYQDTNRSQRDLVNLINGDQGRLFIVGDAKQSIYRFRGADVTVFREERKRVDTSGGSVHSLATSYRAHEELIDGLNALLRPVLGDEEEPDRPWREPFSPLTPFRQNPCPGFEKPFIELQLAIGSKSDGALNRAAQALATYLVGLVQDSRNKVQYGDIAILCRASTSFGAYEDALDDAHIPYLTVAGRGFFDRPEIRDLLNALKALNDPTDDLAVMGLLRSPVIGFSDIELFDLCKEWEKAGREVPLFSFLEKKDDAKAIRARNLIQKLNTQSSRTPVAHLLKTFLDDTQYRAALFQAGYIRAARNVAKLLADAHASGLVAVHEFLEYIDGLRAVTAREGEARAAAGNVVRIMSVHAAKGLEFPIVVLGDINKQSPFGNDLIIDTEFGIALSTKDNDGLESARYRLVKQIESDQEDAEADRLLYVAATRAEEMLILNGCIGLSNNGKPSRLTGWLKKLAEPLALESLQVAYDEIGDKIHEYELSLERMPVACTVFEPQHPVRHVRERDAEGDQATIQWSPALLGRVKTEAIEADEDSQLREKDPPLRAWRVVPPEDRGRAPAWIVGQLVHAALANRRFPDEFFNSWLRSRARELGLVDRERLADAVRRSIRILSRFERHNLYRQMASAERWLTEVPYSLHVDDDNRQFEQGIIDALFLKDGIWTVVEYKTDRLKDQQALDKSLQEKDYLGQLSRYSKAVEQLLGSRPRALLVFLDFENRIHIREANTTDAGES